MIYAIITIVILCIFICVFLKIKVHSPKAKGKRGEKVVANILGETIGGVQYVINNLLFTDDEGHSCQIDHIYINRFGIWVIETKNYAGRIYGTDEQREWTQVLSYGNTKNKFYNPVKQNQTHIYRLSKYLNIKNVFFNIVVFLNNADLSNVKAENIYSICNLKSIKSKETDTTLSVEQMENYYRKLLELHNNPRVDEKEHIENIHTMQRKIERGICPRCGGTLVLRNGKNGQFYGCSNYPSCKFTKNND